MPPKTMRPNPVMPARYRAGKPVAPEPETSEEEESEEEAQQKPTASAPKATSFPSAKALSNNLKNVDLNARREQAAAQEAARLEAKRIAKAKEEEGFETEDSEEGSEEDGSESGEESESDEESSSDDGAARRKMLRPVFVKKDQRKMNGVSAPNGKSEEDKYAEEEAKRKAKADAVVQEQLEKNAAAKAAGKKQWDNDEDVLDAEAVDDTDGLDVEAERAAWKLRELRRVKREREKIEQEEAQIAEIERRKNLTPAEREAEDREFLKKQREEQGDRGKMGYMQKYFHKGAFFQDDAKEQGLDRREIAGAKFADDVNRELLPQYMQIRDMTKLGKKGRTRYKDLRSEDTGRWGEFGDRKGAKNDYMDDDRFKPDKGYQGGGATGANAKPIGERKRYGDETVRDGKRPRVED
ncbi:hypothetical protein M501DRAFT_935678 [Patellaria atrata CBS 101060]|uniref:Micro-fibrillar-associated protein 1 C-terminal domain-containing protein n=1 Tax=Patellaria atrata CBS 101060 TaxID=1346257 RepID=A0A9P4VM92_9PEZI|nr:hypothetical protein M501DRAFT_935678 [Patellaria atrata CBS 101060]